MTVLVVENTRAIRRTIVNCLNEYKNVDIIEVSNAEDAFSELFKIKVDLIITNYDQPKLHGLEFVQKVKKKDGFVNIPILMIVDRTSDTEIIAATNAGVNDVVVRPIELKVLKKKLNKIIRNFLTTKDVKTFKGKKITLPIDNTIKKVSISEYSLGPIPDVVKNSYLVKEKDFWKTALYNWLSVKQITTDGIEKTTYYQKSDNGSRQELEVTKQPDNDDLFIEIVGHTSDVQQSLSEIWEKLEKITKIQ